MNPATVGEIRAACTGVDSDTVVGMVERGLDLPTAQREWIGKLNDRVRSAENSGNRVLDPTRRPGVNTGISSGGSRGSDEIECDGGGAVDEFGDAVSKLMENRGMDRQKAVMAVARKNPDLHKRFLQETNSGSRTAQRLIEDRFAG